jgi:hypothetical protein
VPEHESWTTRWTTLSVLWARERVRCAPDSFDELLDGGEYLVRDLALGGGAFSFEGTVRLPRTGRYQICAYVEEDVFDLLAIARTTVYATPPADCSPRTPNAMRFAGLPRRIVVGKRERFGLKSIGPRARVDGRVEVRIVARNGRGKPLLRQSTTRRGSRLFSIRLRYRKPPVRVYASYVQRLADGTLCRQEMSRRVRGQDRVYVNFSAMRQYRPRILYMGASARIVNLRWRGWNKPKARARGILPFNDCVPYCAAGNITPYPVRVILRRVRLCGNHYRYLKMTYRYTGRKPPQVPRSLKTRARCSW